jgi:hypothetical protein
MTDTNPFVPTLSNHPFFNPDLIPAEGLDELCNELWPLVQGHLNESRKKPYGVEYVFRSLIANFITVMRLGEPVLIVPRNKSFFPAKSRYRATQATYGNATKAIDAMVSSGLIAQELGSGQHKVTRSYHGDLKCVREATRVRPTDYLTQCFTPLLVLPVHSLTQWRTDTEVIHLRTKTQDKGKASSTEQVPYDDTPMTNTFRTQVRRINQHLKDHPCHYAGQHRINLMHDHVLRIFNNGDWQQGGRLYGYWPMNLPSGERHLLSIDDEPLADLDFGSCFVALLHVQDGTEFDPEAPDPFTISGYEEYRDMIKQCAYAILNTPKRIGRYPEGVIASGSKPPLTWKQMEAVIFDHIPLFRKYKYSAIGLGLMRRESDILIAVLLDLISQGIGFIPMHDGIMVPASRERLTRDLMLRHYHAITGQRINVKRKEIRRPPQEPSVRLPALSLC